MDIQLISFGYLHLDGGHPPTADHIMDVRTRLTDPAAFHQIRSMLERENVDGRDYRVQDIVFAATDAYAVLDELTAHARRPGIAALAVGCAQGHDRSVAIIERLAGRATAAGRTVTIDHRHVRLPRIR